MASWRQRSEVWNATYASDSDGELMDGATNNKMESKRESTDEHINFRKAFDSFEGAEMLSKEGSKSPASRTSAFKPVYVKRHQPLQDFNKAFDLNSPAPPAVKIIKTSSSVTQEHIPKKSAAVQKEPEKMSGPAGELQEVFDRLAAQLEWEVSELGKDDKPTADPSSPSKITEASPKWRAFFEDGISLETNRSEMPVDLRSSETSITSLQSSGRRGSASPKFRQQPISRSKYSDESVHQSHPATGESDSSAGNQPRFSSKASLTPSSLISGADLDRSPSRERSDNPGFGRPRSLSKEKIDVLSRFSRSSSREKFEATRANFQSREKGENVNSALWKSSSRERIAASRENRAASPDKERFEFSTPLRKASSREKFEPISEGRRRSNSKGDIEESRYNLRPSKEVSRSASFQHQRSPVRETFVSPNFRLRRSTSKEDSVSVKRPDKESSFERAVRRSTSREEIKVTPVPISPRRSTSREDFIPIEVPSAQERASPRRSISREDFKPIQVPSAHEMDSPRRSSSREDFTSREEVKVTPAPSSPHRSTSREEFKPIGVPSTQERVKSPWENPDLATSKDELLASVMNYRRSNSRETDSARRSPRRNSFNKSPNTFTSVTQITVDAEIHQNDTEDDKIFRPIADYHPQRLSPRELKLEVESESVSPRSSPAQSQRDVHNTTISTLDSSSSSDSELAESSHTVLDFPKALDRVVSQSELEKQLKYEESFQSYDGSSDSKSEHRSLTVDHKPLFSSAENIKNSNDDRYPTTFLSSYSEEGLHRALASSVLARQDKIQRAIDNTISDREPSPERRVTKARFVNPEMPGYVGFANLPNQVHRKSVKKGFEFTLMVVGETGLGKSTLVNSLFLTDLYPERQIPGAAEKIEKTVSIEASTVEIEERGVRLRLTVVDTPGYGDAMNNNDSFKSIIKYVDEQFEKYLNDESGLNRRNIVDNRVHSCFYFINPAGHGLKPLDISFMRALHNKVNIVPVIAKADTLTKQEVQRLKRKVMDQIEQYGISIYPLPDCDSDEDEDYKEQCKQLKAAVPFAVVGSNQIIEVRGRKVRGRTYPWGVVEVENPDHCDFIKLRTMLITHMQDLQEVTQEVHYENFRSQRLASGPPISTKKTKSRRADRDAAVPDQLLQDKESEILRMKEELLRMQQEMARQRQASGAAGVPSGDAAPLRSVAASGAAPALPPNPPPVNNNTKTSTGPTVNGRVNGSMNGRAAPVIKMNQV